MKGATNTQPDEPTVAGLDEESQSTAQEAQPVPYFAGSQVIAARWISPLYNQFSEVAPDAKPGKK